MNNSTGVNRLRYSCELTLPVLCSSCHLDLKLSYILELEHSCGTGGRVSLSWPLSVLSGRTALVSEPTRNENTFSKGRVSLTPGFVKPSPPQGHQSHSVQRLCPRGRPSPSSSYVCASWLSFIFEAKPNTTPLLPGSAPPGHT